MLRRVELNIVIVAITDNRGRIHRLESVGHGCPLFRSLRLGLWYVYESYCSEQESCAEYYCGGISEKLFHFHCLFAFTYVELKDSISGERR